MNKKKFKPLISLAAAVLCMAAFSVTAFASGDDWCEYGDYDTPDTVESAEIVESTEYSEAEADVSAGESEKPGAAEIVSEVLSAGDVISVDTLTLSGNLTLVDDIMQADSDSSEEGTDTESEEKQFITVQSKNGNYFYIIIDRSGDEENVHFLNLVDEADLLALMDEEEIEEVTASCTCTDKCVVGDIDTSCPVCRTNMSECTGAEQETENPDDTDTEQSVQLEETESSTNSSLLAAALVLTLAGGGAVYYFKFRKRPASAKGSVSLDDYDFGNDDEEDEDYKFEPDDDEPEERNEGD